MTTATDHVHVVVSLQAGPEHVAALLAVLADLARTCQKQPGNHRFEVLQQAGDPTRFITIEHWDSAASADAHMASAHVGAALSRLGPLLAGPPQIVRYTRLV